MSNRSVIIGQAQALGYYAQQPTVDQAISRLRSRAEELRSNIESVDKWRAELKKLDAVLKAWGDK